MTVERIKELKVYETENGDRYSTMDAACDAQERDDFNAWWSRNISAMWNADEVRQFIFKNCDFIALTTGPKRVCHQCGDRVADHGCCPYASEIHEEHDVPCCSECRPNCADNI